MGDGDHDQGDEKPVASSTSEGDGAGRGWGSSMPAFRSVVSVLVSFVGRTFSTNSRPALRHHDRYRGTGLTLRAR
jgi:hypothetical protein